MVVCAPITLPSLPVTRVILQCLALWVVLLEGELRVLMLLALAASQVAHHLLRPLMGVFRHLLRQRGRRLPAHGLGGLCEAHLVLWPPPLRGLRGALPCRQAPPPQPACPLARPLSSPDISLWKNSISVVRASS